MLTAFPQYNKTCECAYRLNKSDGIALQVEMEMVRDSGGGVGGVGVGYYHIYDMYK